MLCRMFCPCRKPRGADTADYLSHVVIQPPQDLEVQPSNRVEEEVKALRQQLATLRTRFDEVKEHRASLQGELSALRLQKEQRSSVTPEALATLPTAVEADFRRMDKDGDGLVTEKELFAAMHIQGGWPHERVAYMLDKFDSNRDGKLSLGEYAALCTYLAGAGEYSDELHHAWRELVMKKGGAEAAWAPFDRVLDEAGKTWAPISSSAANAATAAGKMVAMPEFMFGDRSARIESLSLSLVVCLPAPSSLPLMHVPGLGG